MKREKCSTNNLPSLMAINIPKHNRIESLKTTFNFIPKENKRKEEEEKQTVHAIGSSCGNFGSVGSGANAWKLRVSFYARRLGHHGIFLERPLLELC